MIKNIQEINKNSIDFSKIDNLSTLQDEEKKFIKDCYQKDGFFIMEKLLPNDMIDSITNRTMGFIEDANLNKSVVFDPKHQETTEYFLKSAENISFFYEPNVFDQNGELKVDKNACLNKIGHAMHDIDPEFEKFSYNPYYKDILQILGYENPTIVQSMIIFKNPKIGGEVPKHTDNSYIMTDPKTCIGIWVAMEDATKENGCMWAYPGSQKNPTTVFWERQQGTNELKYNTPNNDYPKYENLGEPVPLEMKKGSVIFFNGDLIHYSDHNYSSKRRLAYTLHIVEKDTSKWLPTNWLQRPNLPFREMYKVKIQ